MFNNTNQYGYDWRKPMLDTNVEFVTSLEEAVMKTVNRPSDRVYFHQDLPLIYRVKVDMEGRKSWAEISYNVPNVNSDAPVSRADYEALVKRLEALEGVRNERSTEPDGPITV